MLALSSSAQETTVVLDLDSPTTLVTGYKEGFEIPVNYLSSEMYNAWLKAPYKYVNAPITEMPLAKLKSPQDFSNKGDASVDTASSPVAQIIDPSGLVINFNWRNSRSTVSMKYDEQVGLNFNTFPFPISRYYVFDTKEWKAVLKNQPKKRAITWRCYHDFTIIAPAGNKITRIYIAPPCHGSDYSKYGKPSTALTCITFHATPKPTAITEDEHPEIGTKRPVREKDWGEDQKYSDYYQAIEWTPTEDEKYREVSVRQYYYNSNKFLVTGSIVVTYEPDEEYVAPTEPSTGLSIGYTNRISEEPGVFLNSTRISFTPDGPLPEGAAIYFTTDGSDPAVETNLMRTKVTDPATYGSIISSEKTVRAIVQEPGKLPGEETTLTLRPLEKTNYTNVGAIYGNAEEGTVAHVNGVARVAAVERDGDVTYLTLIDPQSPPRAITVKIDGAELPASYTAGARCTNLTFDITHLPDGRLCGDATPYISYWDAATASDPITLQPMEQRVTGERQLVRYEFLTIDADGSFTSPAGEKMRIVSTMGGLDAGEWFEAERNAIECVSGDMDADGVRTMYLVNKIHCPGVAEVSVDKRQITGNSVRFSTETAMVEVTRQTGGTAFYVMGYGDTAPSLLGEDEYIQMTASTTLGFYTLLNGMQKNRVITFTKVDAAQAPEIADYAAAAAEGAEIIRCTAPLTVVWRSGKYTLAADDAGEMLLLTAPEDAEIEPGMRIVDFTSNTLTTESGLTVADITDYDDLFGHLEEPAEVTAPVEIFPEEKTFTDADVMKGIYTISDLRIRPVAGGGKAVNTTPQLIIDESIVSCGEYNPNLLYRITATAVKPSGSDGSLRLLLLGMEEEPQCSQPLIEIGSEDGTFIREAMVSISGNDGEDIRYTTDGSNPRTSATAKLYTAPFEIRATTTVSAYASRRGMTPGAAVTATFTRLSVESSSLGAVMLQTSAGKIAHFTGSATVQCVAKNYIIVGDARTRLALRTNGSGLPAYAPGDIIGGFVVSPDPELPYGNCVGTAGYESTFTAATGNAATAAATEIEEAQLARQAAWSRVKFLTTFAELRVNLTELGRPEGWVDTPEEGHTYRVEGIVAPTADGTTELWALGIEDVTGTPPVIAATDGSALFHPTTMVEITHPDPEATIHYSTDGGTTWKLYDEPFEIDATTTVEAYAEVPDKTVAYATPATFTLRGISCGVAADTEVNADGSVTVSLYPALNDAEGKIYYTYDQKTELIPTDELLYTAPFTLTATAAVRAIMVETEKVAGPLFVLPVIVKLIEVPDTPVQPDKPENPDKPETPDVPDTPDQPENPDKPTDPEKPDQPATPDNPVNPDTPDNPDQPENPGEPEQPDDPSAITAPGSDREERAGIPRGSRVYDLAGRLHIGNTLRKGVYIIVTPQGKTYKLLISATTPIGSLQE